MSSESSKWLNDNIMVGFDRTPWWAKGRREDHPNLYSGPLNRDEIYKKLLMWQPLPKAIYDEDMNQVEGYVRLVDSTNPRVTLGIHGSDYQIHHYDEVLTATELDIISCGLLKGKRQFWVQFGKGEDVDTPEGVTFLPYIMFSTSLDGSMSSQVNDGSTLAVCDNTVQCARFEGERVKIRHSRLSGTTWLADTAKAIKHLERAEQEMKDEISTLCQVKVTEPQWSKFVNLWQPLPEKKITKSGGPGQGYTNAENRRAFIDSLYHEDYRVAPWQGTAFGVVNAVNTYANHNVLVRGGTDDIGKEAVRVSRNMERMARGKWGEVDQDTLSKLELAMA